MDVVLKRIDGAFLKCVTNSYIDYKETKDADRFYFAYIDKGHFAMKRNLETIVMSLGTALLNNTPVSLVIESRLEHVPSKGEKRVDYLIKVEF